MALPSALTGVLPYAQNVCVGRPHVQNTGSPSAANQFVEATSRTVLLEMPLSRQLVRILGPFLGLDITTGLVG